jgi:hypothetical protein
MPRRAWSRWIVAAGLAAALLVPTVIGAVYVSPSALFLDDANRNGELTIGNASSEPEEVRIELMFGFVDTDSAGTPFVRLIDDPGPELPSALHRPACTQACVLPPARSASCVSSRARQPTCPTASTGPG